MQLRPGGRNGGADFQARAIGFNAALARHFPGLPEAGAGAAALIQGNGKHYADGCLNLCGEAFSRGLPQSL